MEENNIDYSDVINQSLMREFWDKHWRENDTKWDMGQPSPPISEYIKKYANKDAAILIPGCGNAHEAEFLVEQNFTNITLVDISPTAVENLAKKFKDHPNVKPLCVNFFGHHGKYDLILEQTFFCAIAPDEREEYVKHVSELLNDGGKLAGLLFNKDFGKDMPPFGGNKNEYESLFSPYFNLLKLEECYNSIVPRQGSELFFIFEKK